MKNSRFVKGAVLAVLYSFAAVRFRRGPECLCRARSHYHRRSLLMTGQLCRNRQADRTGNEAAGKEVNEGGMLGRKVEFKIYDDGVERRQGAHLCRKGHHRRQGRSPLRRISRERRPAPSCRWPRSITCVRLHGRPHEELRAGIHLFVRRPSADGEWWYEGFIQLLKKMLPSSVPNGRRYILMNNPIGLALMPSIEKMSKELGIELVINEKYNLPLADATPLIVKAKQMNCDLLFSSGFFADGVMTVRPPRPSIIIPRPSSRGLVPSFPRGSTNSARMGTMSFPAPRCTTN